MPKSILLPSGAADLDLTEVGPARRASVLDFMVDAIGEAVDPDAGIYDAEALAMETDFGLFCRSALKTFVPQDVIWSWHLDALCDHLQAVSDGQIQNLIINLPPRCLKSSITSVCWPAWEWITNPKLRYLFTSYDRNLSIRDSVYTRSLIRNPWYQVRWGKRFGLSKEQDAKTLYETTEGGRRLASSVRGANTGEGGERIVVDDPHNVLKGESEADREFVINWWQVVMSNRVNRADASKIIIAQRVHHLDLTGYIIDQMLYHGGEPYERLILPMEYDPKLIEVVGIQLEATSAPVGDGVDPEVDVEADVRPYFEAADDETLDLDTLDDEIPSPGDPYRGAPLPIDELDAEDRPDAVIPFRTGLGFADPRRYSGELLIPEQWPEDWVARQKKISGPYQWSAQYQQSPSPAEGGQFKERYWGRFRYELLWHRGLRPEIIVVDSSWGTADGDFTGVSVWGQLGGFLYVLDAYQWREETPELRRRLRDLHAKYRVPFLIENKANGRALIADLRRSGGDDGGGYESKLPALPVIEFEPDGMTKEARAFSVVNYVAAGMVALREGAEWVTDWVQQHKQFPKGAHDDWVDTTAMAVIWLKKHTSQARETIGRPVPSAYGASVRGRRAALRGGYWRRTG